MDMRDTVIPEDALLRLAEGNRRFATGTQDHPRSGPDRRREVRAVQRPFAVILACADSRVPPEIVFDQGIGDLFVIRVAGNVLDDTVIASVQYALTHLGCRLVVVLGHENCGAVTTSLQPPEELATEPASIAALAGAIQDNIPNALATPGPVAGRLAAAVAENAASVARALAAEHGIAPLLEHGAARVRTAMYSFADGTVSFD